MSSPRTKLPEQPELKEYKSHLEIKEEKPSDNSTEFYVFHTQKCNFPPCFVKLPILVSELYRFWSNCPQPLVEIVEEKISLPNRFVSAGENKPTETKEQSVTQYHYLLPTEIGETQSFTTAINNRNSLGLANLLIVSLFLEQTELNINRLGFIEGKGVVNWNFDHALYSTFHNKLYNPNSLKTINKENILKLSDIYFNNTALNAFLATDKNFKLELFTTILKIIVTPIEIIYKIIDTYFNDQKIEKSRQELILTDYSKRVAELTNLRDILSGIKQSLHNTFLLNKSLLEFESLFIREFRDFLFKTDTTKEELSLFFIFLKQFITEPELINQLENKILALSNPIKLTEYVLGNPDCKLEYKEKFINEMINDAIHHQICSPHQFEKLVLENKEFSIAFKKQTIQQIFNFSIQNATQLHELEALEKKLETDKSFDVIKQRSGFTTYSFWGYNHHGDPVSKTFSEIMGTIKKRMREIGDHSAHQTPGYWGSSPLLQHFSQAAHSVFESKKVEEKNNPSNYRKA